MALTFEDIQNKSTPINFVSDVIYQDTADVDVMGLRLYRKEIGTGSAVYKDAAFKKPLSNAELLSIFFSNTVPFNVTGDNNNVIVLDEYYSRSSSVSYMQYKDGSYTKNYFRFDDPDAPLIAGEIYDDISKYEASKKSGSNAVVGTAIVGKDTVGGETNL